MKPTMRSYNSDEDYWRIRDFLRSVMLSNNRHDLSWHVTRWDYLIWSARPDEEKIALEENVFIWETESRQIVAVLHPEDRGCVFLQIHPDFCTSELEEEMVATAEKHLTSATLDRDGKPRLWIWPDSQDIGIQKILMRRGFQRIDRMGLAEFKHRCSLDEPLPDVPATPGYAIRALGDGLELLERCYAMGLGFRKDDVNAARNKRDHPEWYYQLQSAPLYRRDLDIVAVAEDGSIASFCTIWFDDVTRTACFEPVATVPTHQRRGLARAMMVEGMHRLKHMGCKVAFVSGSSEVANALYFSVMGSEHDIYQPWEKILAS
ncbi:MAG: GNAT family N-acetyltransferase [Chloroflexi bacterium]|nr:GNAT family N-acetyltransferase [Chloroflexota bacterium]